jgi:hypothetical protein
MFAIDFNVIETTSFISGPHVMVSEAGSTTTTTSYPVSYIFSTEVSSIDNGIDNLIRDACRHVQQVSFLPIDPEIDAFVDSIVNEATSGMESSPLTRRL